MYIATEQEYTAPQGTKFWCQQKLLVTSVICCQFRIIDDNSFWKIHCFTFFPYKSIRDQIWPCRKICQGQPRVIIWATLPCAGVRNDNIHHLQHIWANLVVLKHQMMHTKIQGHWPFGSGEEDFFFRFLPYMAMATILVMWPGPFEQTFVENGKGGGNFVENGRGGGQFCWKWQRPNHPIIGL